MFGVVSALFSALAFAGVIYAVILHRQDLSNYSGWLSLAVPVIEKALRYAA
jgi:hypothetical protein